MDSQYTAFQFLLTFIIMALIFGLTPLVIARLWFKKFSPLKPGPDKNNIYECGLEPRTDAPIQFRSQYYIYAIIFLVFDVETLFLLPFAVTFTEIPLGAFIAVAVFILLLAEGLAWAWLKGLLTWK
jgi:NADH:ubiquinone oxidoreductase subunit 3 (subunit A)